MAATPGELLKYRNAHAGRVCVRCAPSQFVYNDKATWSRVLQKIGCLHHLTEKARYALRNIVCISQLGSYTFHSRELERSARTEGTNLCQYDIYCNGLEIRRFTCSVRTSDHRHAATGGIAGIVIRHEVILGRSLHARVPCILELQDAR